MDSPLRGGRQRNTTTRKDRQIPVHDKGGALATAELVDLYVSNMPPNTIRVYKKAVDKIAAWLGGLPLNDSTLATINEYRERASIDQGALLHSSLSNLESDITDTFSQ